MKTYILATNKELNIQAFEKRRRIFPGRWVVVVTTQDLETAVNALRPRFIFFPHWSHIVPQSILERAECVCFHMTDVPYGRGGSPLQNLISRGHTDTVISALHMIPELDAGPVYMKRPLSLDGSAREIFLRSAALIVDMIGTIVREEPAPVSQEGQPTIFARRKPEQSRLSPELNAEQIYDHIRMLDADGYPHSFIDHGRWRVHFTEAQRHGKHVDARARFTKKDDL